LSSIYCIFYFGHKSLFIAYFIFHKIKNKSIQMDTKYFSIRICKSRRV